MLFEEDASKLYEDLKVQFLNKQEIYENPVKFEEFKEKCAKLSLCVHFVRSEDYDVVNSFYIECEKYLENLMIMKEVTERKRKEEAERKKKRRKS